jgi:hypothetical protein
LKSIGNINSLRKLGIKKLLGQATEKEAKNCCVNLGFWKPAIFSPKDINGDRFWIRMKPGK